MHEPATVADANGLVADVGATNARFQLCSKTTLVGEPVVLPTAEFKNAGVLLTQVQERLPCQQVTRVLFAVAGPVNTRGDITVTNTGLTFKQDECARQLGVSTHLVNDFYALAHGVPYFSELVQLGGALPEDNSSAGNATAAGAAPGNKALLGPGSGLGMAALVPQVGGDQPGWRVVSSEGGHADLAAGSPLEAELWQFLAQKHGHVSWETVLCGSGLQNLYQAMCGVWGAAPEALNAAQISARGVSMEDPVCHQTLECFCALLGSAAGNLALTVTAVGGVYIGGGIVPQMVDFVRTSPLRRRFEERGEMSDYVQQIPLYIICDHNPGLLAALHCLNAN